MMNYYKNNKGGCLVTHEVEGRVVWYEVMTFEQYKGAKIDNPFCLDMGGRLYYKLFTTYVNEYGDMNYIYNERKVFVVIDKK